MKKVSTAVTLQSRNISQQKDFPLNLPPRASGCPTCRIGVRPPPSELFRSGGLSPTIQSDL